jgi:acetolactate synthase-1/2/3 large subunit
MDSDPVIALTGQVPTNLVGNDAFQETDTIGVTSPVTKFNRFASSPDEVGDDVGTAWALAKEGRQGPTLVDLPKDVTQPETDVEPGKAETPDTYNPPEDADEEIVDAAAECLMDADRPVILAGGGVIKGEAWNELRDFAKEYEVPVITTMPGTTAFPEDHELSMGIAGMHGTGYANMAITLTDCLLGIGTRFDDRLTGGIDSFAPDAEVIHVDIDAAEISKNVHADYPLLGDAATVIDQLDEAMTRAPEIEEWHAQCEQWKDEFPMDYDMPEDRPLKPQFIVEQFDEHTPDDTIVTTGVGQHQMWAWQFWDWKVPRTWVSSHGLGTMGYGLPAAIGAKVAAPDQEVVCFDGDGSFLMTSQELSVAVRENLDITVVVLNNEAIGMVRQWQDGFYEGRHMASEYPWIPQFDKLAEAYGARGWRLEDYDNVEETIQEALDYDGPSVVDVIIDPAENVYPMVPSGADNSRFALTEDQLEDV